MDIKYIDIHAHAYSEYYVENEREVIQRAADAKVAIINIGVDLPSSRLCILNVDRYADIHTRLYSVPGIHPSDIVDNYDKMSEEELKQKIDRDLEELDNLVDKNLYSKNGRGKVVGIGECGIDLFRVEDETMVGESEADSVIKTGQTRRTNRKAGICILQKELFRGQIEIALKYDIPLMIHARESYSEILAILDENFIGDKAKLRGNVHFFAGTSDDARMFLDRGFTVSFTGVITFASSYDEVIRSVPLDKIMSETDSPYVAPTPFRGKPNEPAYVPYIVNKIAEIKDMDPEECREALLANAEREFGITLKS